MFKLLIFCIFFTACATPDQWRPADHAMLMQKCRILCGKNRAASYEALSGECTCCGKDSK